MLLTITVGLIDDKLESTTTAVAGPKFVKGKHFPLDLKGDFFQLRAQIGVQVIGFSAFGHQFEPFLGLGFERPHLPQV